MINFFSGFGNEVGPTPIWEGPFDNLGWSFEGDGCFSTPGYGIGDEPFLATEVPCKQACLNEDGCNAIEVGEGTIVGDVCVMWNCPVPIPDPTYNSGSGWKGYYCSGMTD